MRNYWNLKNRVFQFFGTERVKKSCTFKLSVSQRKRRENPTLHHKTQKEVEYLVNQWTFFIQTFLWLLLQEAVAYRCSVKKIFLEISQNSQENTCARISFLIKRLWDGFFPVNFAKFLRTSFLQNTYDGCFCFAKTNKQLNFIENVFHFFVRWIFFCVTLAQGWHYVWEISLFIDLF